MDELLSNPFIKRIIHLLPSHEPVYLVGGAIRDALLKRPIYDLDFVTGGEAMKIARHVAEKIGAAYFPLDPERNMARLVLKPKEGQAKGATNLGRIDFSKFQGPDLQSDLSRRDFTMNAIAAEVHQLQTLLDPLGGAKDLVSKRLRACSERSFLDDPVRILRAIRFSVDLELKIQPTTLHLLRQAIGHLSEVSAERLRDELFRILVQPHPSTSLRILDKLEALEPILPEVSLLKGVQQAEPHIWDAWEHTLETITRLEDLLDVLADEFNPDKTSNLAMGIASLQLGRFRPYLVEHLQNCLNPDRPHRGIIFLASLYHDVGKAKTRTVDERGKTRFIDHDQIGSKLAEKRGHALRLSKVEIERLTAIVSQHMRPSLLSHTHTPPTRRAIYRFFNKTGAAGVDICLLSLADILATYGPTLPQDRWARHLEAVRELLQVWWERGILPPPLINGDELMKELEIPPGPEVGYILEAIREAQVVGDIHTRQEAIDHSRFLLQEFKNKEIE